MVAGACGASLRVLVVTDDVLTARMAGPAIRAWHIAEALAAAHEVRLVTTTTSAERRSDRFSVESADGARFGELEQWCDVVVLQGHVLDHEPVLRSTEKIMLVDLYDPLHLEALELSRATPEPARSIDVASTVRTLRDQLSRGDFFICASDKQRDLWLGFLSVIGRINPSTYGDDPTLRRLIDVVPFGLPERPPTHRRPVLKGVVPGIAESDHVIVWGGGIYDWFDPLTLLRAVDALRRRRPNVRLYFPGMQHPQTVVVESRVSVETRRLADELGLTGTHVFFNEGWVDYDDRQDYLTEADIGVSLHIEHAETAFSFRTRILDYLWAGLPIVATAGDGFAELIAAEQLGRVVPGEDVGAVVSALDGLLADGETRSACGRRAAAVGARFTWPRVLAPLVAFCADPHRAADLPRWPAEADAPAPTAVVSGPVSAPRLYDRVAALYRHGGVRAVARSAGRRLRRIALR